MIDFQSYRWIPFNEQKPEIGMSIVCLFDTFTFDDDILGIITYYGESGGYGSAGNQNIIAWMPIPTYNL